MLIKENKGFLKTILIILDDQKIKEIINRGFFSAITIISYKEFFLPKFKMRKKTTALINLKKKEEEIFGKFNDTTRNEIYRTRKIDSLSFVSDDHNFKEAYDLYCSFEKEQGRPPVDKKKFTSCKIFTAYYKKELISGFFIFCSEPYIRIRSIFSKRLMVDDKNLYKIISCSSRRLMWELCLWGKKNGFETVDLASVNFDNPKTANITKFKMSFGGDVVNEYTYIYKSFFYKMFENFIFLKILIFKFKKYVGYK